MDAESKVLEVYPDAYAKRSRVWRIYTNENRKKELLGSAITKADAWAVAWRNVPRKVKQGFNQWRRLDKMREKMSADGWDSNSIYYGHAMVILYVSSEW